MTFQAGNLFLDSLHPDARARLGEQVMHLDLGTRLFAAGEFPQFVFFPLPGTVVSIVRGTSHGTSVETGLCGSEGMTSVHAVIAPQQSNPTDGIVQVGADAIRVTSGRAREAFENDLGFREGVLACTNDLLTQITQNAVCNRLHLLEQRLAKWLLVLRVRTGSDELRVTHEFIAQMLGIHRPGVSVAIDTLVVDGAIEHARNRIAIRNVSSLERRSCECAAVVNESYSMMRATLSPEPASSG